MKYLEYMKLRPKMDCYISDLVWFNESALAYLRKLFAHLLPNIQPGITVLSDGFFESQDVRVSWPQRYEVEFICDDDWCGYLPTYGIVLRVGPSDRMKFMVYYIRGYLEFDYVDHVGNVYDSNMLRDELKEFLRQIYDDICEIHFELLYGCLVSVDDI